MQLFLKSTYNHMICIQILSRFSIRFLIIKSKLSKNNNSEIWVYFTIFKLGQILLLWPTGALSKKDKCKHL